jgi:hypothetical protein
MKHSDILAIGFCMLGLVIPASVWAAKADGRKAKLFAKYDTNSNGILDENERKAIQADYDKARDGDLKSFDKDHDGKFSPEEFEGMKAGAKGGKAGGGKKADGAAK